MLNISCNFSIYACILFLRSWIIITLNYFPGRLTISSSFSFFSGVFFLFLCLKRTSLSFHFVSFVCSWSPFCMLQASISLVSGVFPLVGKVVKASCWREFGAFPLVSEAGVLSFWRSGLCQVICLFLFFVFLSFLGLHPWHVDVSRLGV